MNSFYPRGLNKHYGDYTRVVNMITLHKRKRRDKKLIKRREKKVWLSPPCLDRGRGEKRRETQFSLVLLAFTREE